MVIVSINTYVLYKKESARLIDRERKKKENIKSGVAQFVDNYDLSLKLIELEVEQRINKLFDVILDDYRADLQNQNLDSLQAKLKMNPLTEDIYIINKSGKIVNTTFPQDLNLNIFEFGETYKNFLLNILSEQNRVIERVAIESKTQTQKKIWLCCHKQ